MSLASCFEIFRPPRESWHDRNLLYGVYPAVVTNNADPQGMHRVKVRFVHLPGAHESWWARVATPMAGKDRGVYFLPEVNDEVLVMFEHGDVHHPVVVGALWNGADVAPHANAKGHNDLRFVRSRAGHRVVLDDTDGAEKIVISEKTGRNRIVIDAATNHIEVVSEDGDLHIKAPNGRLRLESSSLRVHASDRLEIHSGGSFHAWARGKMAVAAGATMDIRSGRTELNPPSPCSAGVGASSDRGVTTGLYAGGPVELGSAGASSLLLDIPVDPERGAVAPEASFADITARVQAASRDRRLAADFARFAASAPRVGSTSHYGCRLRVFEHLAGTVPRVWLVLSPPAALLARDRRQLVLFFGSAAHEDTAALTDPLDADMGKFVRYFSDQPGKGPPWFVIDRAGEWAWRSGPPCGFERQLAESGKAVHCIVPLPHRGDFGSAIADWPDALRRLVDTLEAEGDLAPRSSGDPFDRIALAGASFGGGQALAAWNANRRRVDELWLFDAKDLGRYSGAGGLPAWLGPTRRLRMFGGHYQRIPMRALASMRPARASVVPEEDSYWHRSAVYQAAMSAPGGSGPELTRVDEEPPAGSLSQRCGFRYVAMEDGDRYVRVEARDPDGRTLGELRVEAGARELASMLAFAYPEYLRLDEKKRKLSDVVKRGAMEPPRTLREAREVLRRVWNVTQRVRHKWSVVGGSGPIDRGPSFRGVLRRCLDGSDFE